MKRKLQIKQIGDTSRIKLIATVKRGLRYTRAVYSWGPETGWYFEGVIKSQYGFFERIFYIDTDSQWTNRVSDALTREGIENLFKELEK